MSVTIRGGRIEGQVAAPPSKSYTHRAVVLAGLSGDGRIEGPLDAADTRATLAAFETLGLSADRDVAAWSLTGDLTGGPARIDAANSGTTLRIMTAVASLGTGPVELTGDVSLRKRPMGPLLEALGPLGVASESQGGRPPVVVRGPLRGGQTQLSAEDSSQFLSALLLACPASAGETTVQLSSRPRSRPYVEITRRMLHDYGVRVEVQGDTFRIPGGQRPRARSYRVPGDWSSAAFFLCAAAVSDGRVTVTGLDPEDPQGDRGVVEMLRGFGCRVHGGSSGITVEGKPTQGQRIDLGQTPDLFPVLCAVAAVAPGTSVLAGAPHLRIKESDRIAAMRENLEAFGVACRELPDGIEIDGGTKLSGGQVRTHDDHRIAQAGLLLALAADGTTTLKDPEVLDVSYPNLLNALRSTGGRIGS